MNFRKEAQKCYCGASICRGWLGEEPDEESEEEEEEEDEVVERSEVSKIPELPSNEVEKSEISLKELHETEKTIIPLEVKSEGELSTAEKAKSDVTSVATETIVSPVTPEKKIIKKKVSKKKPRVELFEEIDVKYF